MRPLKQDKRIGGATTFGQMRFLWKMLDGPKSKYRLAKYSILIVIVIAANAITQVRLNNWQGSIYDAIGQRDLGIFLHEITVFLIIVSILLCLGVSQTWFHERLKVRLRQAITFDLLDSWLRPARPFLLPLSGEISVNPDQRIQDDTRRLSELSVDLAVGLVQSTLMLFAFVGVLWQLSAEVVFVINGKYLTVPGYMVWAAIGYAILGSFLTWIVGRPLIAAHTRLRASEARFRYDLVRLSEAAQNVALYRGERAERHLLNPPVNAVIKIMRSIANRLATLTWVTGAYGWLAILAPLVLAAPGYFGGTLSLGGLMMVVGAFYQVQTALRWYVDRFPALAEWRAMLARVIDYRSALEHLESIGAREHHIRYVPDGAGTLTLEHLHVSAPNGRVHLSEPFVEIVPGEHVIIVAPPKSGKTTFVKALAGLWVWGDGIIRFPEGRTIMIVPEEPYLPPGSLKTALAYPGLASDFSDADTVRALDRVQLNRLVPQLREERRWDKDLTIDEQWRLTLARVLLHRPDWIIYDEAIGELDEDGAKIAISIFSSELANTGVIAIGPEPQNYEFYHRTLHLQTRLPAMRLPFELEESVPA